MICVKNVKSLSSDEINSINMLINMYYDYNDLYNNDFVVFEKTSNNQIISFTGMNSKRIEGLCLLNQLCITDNSYNILNKVKNLTNKILIIYLPSTHDFIEYLIENGFIIHQEINGNVLLIYRK